MATSWHRCSQKSRDTILNQLRSTATGWEDEDDPIAMENVATLRSVMRLLEGTEEARKRLAAAIPFMHLALNMAKVQGTEDSTVGMAVIMKNVDGSGKVTATFPEGEGFLTDIAALLGFKDLQELVRDEDA